MNIEDEGIQDEQRDFHEHGKPCLVGVTVLDHDPSKEKYKNMLYLIAYDVRDPRRLRAVAKTCLDYGIRVEYSVFECDLSDESFKMMWSDLCVAIDSDEDAILVYRICGSCVQRIKSMGTVFRPAKALIYMI
jgi:CRISPR-associated protein Cas2